MLVHISSFTASYLFPDGDGDGNGNGVIRLSN